MSDDKPITIADLDALDLAGLQEAGLSDARDAAYVRECVEWLPRLSKELRERIDTANTYPTVLESVHLLETAGFGASGKPNTLLDMVKEACARVAELEAERDNAASGMKEAIIERVRQIGAMYRSENDDEYANEAVVSANTCDNIASQLEKVEINQESGKAVCRHCNNTDCQCSDFDVSPDMGAK